MLQFECPIEKCPKNAGDKSIIEKHIVDDHTKFKIQQENYEWNKKEKKLYKTKVIEIEEPEIPIPEDKPEILSKSKLADDEDDYFKRMVEQELKQEKMEMFFK